MTTTPRSPIHAADLFEVGGKILAALAGRARNGSPRLQKRELVADALELLAEYDEQFAEWFEDRIAAAQMTPPTEEPF